MGWQGKEEIPHAGLCSFSPSLLPEFILALQKEGKSCFVLPTCVPISQQELLLFTHLG